MSGKKRVRHWQSEVATLINDAQTVEYAMHLQSELQALVQAAQARVTQLKLDRSKARNERKQAEEGAGTSHSSSVEEEDLMQCSACKQNFEELGECDYCGEELCDQCTNTCKVCDAELCSGACSATCDSCEEVCCVNCVRGPTCNDNGYGAGYNRWPPEDMWCEECASDHFCK